MNRHLRAMLWRITDGRRFQLYGAGLVLGLCVVAPFVGWVLA